MAIGTPIQLGATTAATGSLTLALTTGADAPAGSLIVVFAAKSNNSAINSVTDTAGNTYIAGTSLTLGTSRMRPFWCLASADLPGGGAITVTYANIAGSKQMAAVAVSGLSAQDTQGAGATSTGTLPSATTGALGWPNEIVFGFCDVGAGAGDTFAEAAGFTSNTPALMTDALRWAFQIVTSSAGVTYAPILGASRVYGVNTLTFSGAVASPFNRAAQFTYLGM